MATKLVSYRLNTDTLDKLTDVSINARWSRTHIIEECIYFCEKVLTEGTDSIKPKTAEWYRFMNLKNAFLTAK